MSRRTQTARVATAAILIALALGPACKTPSPLYASRVDLAPLEQKLTAAGGDPAHILRPRRPADLDALVSGKRYKFVVLADDTLAVAPLFADAPQNEYVHPVLARGAAVRTAGGLRIDREGGRPSAIVIDEDSKSYCPSFASLVAAERAIVALGFAEAIIRREDRPPACVEGASLPK